MYSAVESLRKETSKAHCCNMLTDCRKQFLAAGLASNLGRRTVILRVYESFQWEPDTSDWILVGMPTTSVSQ